MFFSSILNKLTISILLLIASVFFSFSQTPAPPPESPLKKCWTSTVDSAEVRAMLSDAATLYAATSDGKLRAVRADDGSQLWTAEIGGDFVSNMIMANDDLVVISNTSGEKKLSVIRSLSRQTGVVHWRAEVPFSEKYYLGGLERNEIAAVGSSGFAIGVSVENGTTIWKTDLGEVSAEPSFRNGKVLVGSVSKRIYSISTAERGRVLLNVESKWKPTAVALHDEGDFVVGDERGNIAKYDSNGNTGWKFKNGASISYLLGIEGGILAASNDNFLYMLTNSRGGVIWKRRLSGRIALEPVVMKESIFAVTYGDGRGYSVSMKKGKIIDQILNSEKDFTPVTIAGFGEKLIVPGPNGITQYSANCKISGL